MKKSIIISVLLLAGIFSAMAVPPRKGVFFLQQPDGTTFRAMIKGGEYASVTTDENGHALVKCDDGFYRYARFDADGRQVATSYAAGMQAPPEILSESLSIPFESIKDKSLEMARIRADVAMRKAMTKAGQEESRRRHCIVLLAEFSDVPMTFTREDFVELINGRNYSRNGATGSVIEYLEDQFESDWEFMFEVGPVVTLSGKQKDYGAHDGIENDIDPVGAVVEACRLSHDAGVDFSQFDDDGDGEVDNVFLFVAGKDEAEGGGEDCLWSHQYYVKDGGGVALTLDGKIINSYALTTEYGLNDKYKFDFTAIGTFCHEYSHVLGLKDLYDTDYEETDGLSEAMWSTAIMDSGCYLNGSRTPPFYNAIDRETLGIGKPEMLHPGEYTLEPIGKNGRYLRLDHPTNEGEFWLFECRSCSGWDKYLGGSGLLAYHVDKSDNQTCESKVWNRQVTAKERWWSNEVNCWPKHQCADLIEACESAQYLTQIFFPYKENSSLTPETSPALKFWDGSSSDLSICNIRQDGENILFTVYSSDDIFVPAATIMSSDIFQTSAIITWTSSNPDYTGPGMIKYGKSGGQMEEAEAEYCGNGRYAYRIEGLSPGTAYKYSVYFKNNDICGLEDSAAFTTRSRYADSDTYIYLNTVPRHGDGSFPQGAELPLVIWNLSTGEKVDWFFDGVPVNYGPGGYWTVTKSGKLTARVLKSDGSTEIITKEIIVR